VSVREKFERLFADRMDENEAREFLVKLYEKGESVEDVTAAVEVMRSHSVKLPLSEELRRRSIDIVGTGGDNSGSFNISTTVSLLLASMGCVIAEHGNRSITSRSGAADLLEALGYNLELGVEEQVTMLEETGFAFIFACSGENDIFKFTPAFNSPTPSIFTGALDELISLFCFRVISNDF